MEKRSFGKTGHHVTALGFGAAPIGYLHTAYERSANLLNLLLDSGVNLIDTAASYPGSEEMIGKALSTRRQQFVLVSKCGSTLPDVDGAAWSEALITKAIDRSLRKLRTDYLDVMLLHSCDLETLQKGEAIEALVKARQAGKIRHAGYSGDNEAAQYAAGHAEIAVLETSVNFVDQRNIDLVLPVAGKNNLGVIAKRPIANAAWRSREDQPGMYKDYAQTYHQRFTEMKLNPAELGFPGKADEVWPEIALRFTLSVPEVSSAIVGTTNPDNARLNLAHAAKGPLPPQVVAKLRAAFRAADPDGTWVGQT